MSQILHSLSNKAGLTEQGKVPEAILPDTFSVSTTRFVVSVAPQVIVKAPLGNRPPDWEEDDSDAPVFSFLANVDEKWTGYFGSLNPSTIASSHVQIQTGLQVAFAANNRAVLSKELTNNVNLNLSRAGDGKQFIYADFTEEGEFELFSYSDTDSTTRSYKMPAFNSSELHGWGTVSATASDGGRDPYRVFDHKDNTSWRCPKNTHEPTLSLYLSTERVITGYIIKTTKNSECPRKWDILIDDVPVDYKSGVNSIPSSGWKIMFDGPVRGSKLTFKCHEFNSSDRCAIKELTPIFRSEAYYDVPSKTMIGPFNEILRRVYLGYAIVDGGIVTDFHCYSLGSETYVPVNKGNDIREDQILMQDPPYPEYAGYAEIYSEEDDEWYRPGLSLQQMSSDNNTLTAVIDDNQDGLMVKTGVISMHVVSELLGNWGYRNEGEVIRTRCRARISRKG